MEPRIQYAQTADGVSIAFWAIGEGPALVVPPPASPWSHAQLDWEQPEMRRWYERMARGRRLVRYDSRGSGLSDRDQVDCSIDASILDLQAVVDRLGLEKFALYGFYYTGPACITYAARYPERLTHLLLWCSFARSADAQHGPRHEALQHLLDLDYDLFTETLAHSVFGWSEGVEAHRMAQYMRASASQAAVRESWKGHEGMDVTDLLPLVQAPTIVMHRRSFELLDVAVAQELASRIPDAHLKIFGGSSLSPYVGDGEAVMATVDDFLGSAYAQPPEPRHDGHIHHQQATGLATILFTDIENSTALTQRLGDAAAREVFRAHERIVRDSLHAYGGSEVKSLGDGFLATFGSATQALECAMAMQRAFAAHDLQHPETPVRVRIGLNAGEPIAEDDDLFGTSVILASRIAAQAAGREIFAANVVRELTAGKGYLFSDRGETALRGFEDPVRLWELRWAEG